MLQIIPSPYLDALGWTLVHFVWQGAALGLIGWACLRAARQANTRYVIGVATLASMVAIVAATFIYLLSSSQGTAAPMAELSATAVPAETGTAASPAIQAPGSATVMSAILFKIGRAS